MMKYLCLGYHDEAVWQGLPPAERDERLREIFEYDDLLRRNGRFLRGESLEGPRTAATLRCRDGRVTITDGPFCETKEQLGGIMLLEADDLNHAIQILSQHPCLRVGGSFEIRPLNEELTREIARRTALLGAHT